MLIYTERSLRRRRRGRVILVETEAGKKKTVRLMKNLPKGCKTAKRICLSCQKNSIPKLSKYYESKICESCQ